MISNDELSEVTKYVKQFADRMDTPYYSDNWLYCDNAKEIALTLLEDTE